jgi:2-amino-4-hydroxy-6-hydroxymethyldihydropteridine diphosphokinase
MSTPPIDLPGWAQVGEKRTAHIARVTALLDRWASQLRLAAAEAQAWHDVGRFHDALRDAPEAELRRLAGTVDLPLDVLHGPAAANHLVALGETRESVLAAVRWHTVGHASWDRTGRALYMADFLEPGRNFSRSDRAFLADHLPHDFDGVFRQVVRARLEWTLREGKALFPEAVDLWNAVR